MNMRYWVNELRAVKISDTNTLMELKDFVRKPNQTWSGRTANTLDDRVMALVWALIVLDNDICPYFFEVVNMDDNLRPQLIKSLDYGFSKKIVNPVGLFTNEAGSENSNPLPIIFQNKVNNNTEYSDNPDLDELFSQGWKLPEQQIY